jgi:DNA polymerase-1
VAQVISGCESRRPPHLKKKIMPNLNNNFGKWYKINNLQEWKKWLYKIYKKGYFIFDLETTGLNPFWDNQYIKMISFSIDEDEAFALVFESWNKTDWAEILNDLKKLFEDKNVGKIGQNLKFDILWLQVIENIQVKGIIWDTMLSQHTLYPNKSNHLKDMAGELGLGGYENLSVDVQDASGDELIEYGCKDSLITHKIYNLHKNVFVKEPELYKGYKHLLIPVSSVLSIMEYNGIRINPSRLHIANTKTDKIIKNVLEGIKQYPAIKKFEHQHKMEFNPNSHVQLQEILFGDKYENLDSIKETKKKKQPSTDKDVLEYYKDTNPFANLLYTYSQYNTMHKFCNEIKENITPDNRIHTTYWLTETRSGRSSSRNPNCQNFAKGEKDLIGLRNIFIADKGFFLAELDHSQMELRVMAEEAQDDVLKDAVLNSDVHQLTAATCLNKDPKLITEQERRDIGKVMNFQSIYGASEFGVARVLKCNLATARLYLYNFFKKYYKTKEWMDKTAVFVKKNGYVVIRSGFKKYFPNYPNLNDHEIKSAMNTPIQGLAGHILFMALIEVQKFIELNKLKSFLSLEIHDSIVMNIHKSEINILPEIKNLMETCHLKYIPDFKIPLKVDIKIGENLGELKGE